MKLLAGFIPSQVRVLLVALKSQTINKLTKMVQLVPYKKSTDRMGS